MTGLTLALSVLAFAVSAWAAAIAYRQLRYDQDAAGGRGIMFDVAVATQAIVGGRRQANFTVRVELFGPGARYEAELCLVRRGGYYVTTIGDELIRDAAPDGKLKQTWKVLRCTDEPIRWDFSVVPSEAVTDDLWCMFTWVDPRAEAIWTGAYARRLTDPGVLYEWRGYKTRRLRKRVQRWGAASRRKQRPWHRVAAKARPLGRWRVHPESAMIGSEGPAENLDAIERRPGGR